MKKSFRNRAGGKGKRNQRRRNLRESKARNLERERGAEERETEVGFSWWWRWTERRRGRLSSKVQCTLTVCFWASIRRLSASELPTAPRGSAFSVTPIPNSANSSSTSFYLPSEDHFNPPKYHFVFTSLFNFVFQLRPICSFFWISAGFR